MEWTTWGTAWKEDAQTGTCPEKSFLSWCLCTHFAVSVGNPFAESLCLGCAGQHLLIWCVSVAVTTLQEEGVVTLISCCHEPGDGWTGALSIRSADFLEWFAGSRYQERGNGLDNSALGWQWVYCLQAHPLFLVPHGQISKREKNCPFTDTTIIIIIIIK